jgi:hypothetical protein
MLTFWHSAGMSDVVNVAAARQIGLPHSAGRRRLCRTGAGAGHGASSPPISTSPVW